ncbi:hypothetical protein SUDANB174_07580 [Streptomyces sp. enrichment culture]
MTAPQATTGTNRRPVSGSSAASISARLDRARATRDRMVPTGHRATFAGSAYGRPYTCVSRRPHAGPGARSRTAAPRRTGPGSMGPPHGWEPRAHTRRAGDRRAHRTRRRCTGCQTTAVTAGGPRVAGVCTSRSRRSRQRLCRTGRKAGGHAGGTRTTSTSRSEADVQGCLHGHGQGGHRGVPSFPAAEGPADCADRREAGQQDPPGQSGAGHQHVAEGGERHADGREHRGPPHAQRPVGSHDS